MDKNKLKSLSPSPRPPFQFLMTRVRKYRFRARKPLNLTKVGVAAKHKDVATKLKVGGVASSPTIEKLHPCFHLHELIPIQFFTS